MPEDLVLTESSLQRLREELEYLKTTRRRELAEALRKARGYGDLTENFEYHAARREQALVNGRILELERMIERATVVPDAPAGEADAAELGTTVTLRCLDEEEEDWEFVLVDPVQADPIEDRISVQSPVGSAVLGKRVGDRVEVQTPGGITRYEIVALRR